MRIEGLGPVCVCLLITSHLLSVLKTWLHTQRAIKVNICGNLPKTTAFKRYAAKYERRSQYANFSDLPAVSFLRLTHSEALEGTQRFVNNI